MTPREGVEREAFLRYWGKPSPHDSDLCAVAYAAWLARASLAHPAATAREEAIRAEVIEECARVCEARAAKHHGTLTEDLGESYELGWREDEGKDCAEAIRALALARSTGAES